MLSIKNITSSKVAASYFERDDYYVGQKEAGPAEGQWWGKGAEALGLTGDVDKETFRDVLDGRLPNGVELGVGKVDKKHKPGWDLTFSAPKSVSILAEVGGDTRLLEAHDQAVKETLAWMQDEIVTHRARGLFGVRAVESDNLVVALFQHHTSRNQDPQTHTHAVMANAVRSKDGRWVSLNSELFYDHKMAGGAIYRAALARNVQKLGYTVERIHRDGRWEIAEVPANVREAFSTRSQEIKASMEARGLEGYENAKETALRTRGRKEVVPRAQLETGWREALSHQGFEVDRVVSAARGAGDVTPRTPAPLDQAVREAVDRLSDAEAVFSRGDLIRWSLAGAMGRGDVASIERQIAQAASVRAIQESSLKDRSAWTTPAAKEQEKRVLETWEGSRRSVRAAMSRREIEAALAKTTLTEEQKPAAALILSAQDRFTGIVGRPGVGKTYMLGVVRPLMEDRGFTLKGLAANSEAARTIQRESGIPSATLQKHLNEVQRDLAGLRNANPVQAALIRSRYASQVWIIDEGSQVDSRLMRKTFFAADRLGARVTIIGDTKQLAAIGAGKPFDLLLKAGMQKAEMKKIIRQQDKTQIAAIEDVIKGDVRAAMGKLQKVTREIEDRDRRLDAIVSAWRDLGDKRARATVLTARNNERTHLNERLRAVLRSEGKLAGEAGVTQLQRVFAQRLDKVEAEVYQKGDLVLFGRGAKQLGIEAHSYMRVTDVDVKANRVVLETTSGERRTIAWNPRGVAGSAKNGVEIFRERATSLAPGEKIQWNLNDAKLGITNGQVLTVRSVERDRIVVSGDAGRKIELDPQQLAHRHFDHAYATTVYKSQGRTEDTVLVNAEANQTELFNQKAFLVAISRQRQDVRLYTDDTDNFTRNVEKRLGDKTSAKEGANELRVNAARAVIDGLFKRLRDEQVSEQGAEAVQAKTNQIVRDGLSR